MKRVTLFSVRLLVLLVFSSSSFATTILFEDFETDDGGFISANDLNTQPWVYNAGPGNWSVNGSESNSSDFHVSSTLTSPTVLVDGPVVVNFEHLYSFEKYSAGWFAGFCWDAGRVYVSINGGDFTRVALSDFLNNGYTGVAHHWNGMDNFDGGDAFCGNSPNGEPPFEDFIIEDDIEVPVPSDALPPSLVVGTFELDLNAGDSLAVQFFGHWDRTAKADDPNWLINHVSINTAPIEVATDIKPGSDPNSINLKSKGKIPVAVLTTDTFDATQIDFETVVFGPNSASESHGRAHVEDVDLDGDIDMVLHFHTQDTGIQCGDTEVTLTGETFDGQAITGTDAIKTVKCP